MRIIRSILVVVALALSQASCNEQRPFDATEWQNGTPLVRGEMVDDLKRRKLLIGKTADQVHDVLGEPDNSYESALVYRVDGPHIFGTQPWLRDVVIQIDGEGMVTSIVERD